MHQSAQLVRRQLWQDRLKRFQTQSITIKEFCGREGVSLPSFFSACKSRLYRISFDR